MQQQSCEREQVRLLSQRTTIYTGNITKVQGLLPQKIISISKYKLKVFRFEAVSLDSNGLPCHACMRSWRDFSGILLGTVLTAFFDLVQTFKRG